MTVPTYHLEDTDGLMIDGISYETVNQAKYAAFKACDEYEMDAVVIRKLGEDGLTIQEIIRPFF